MALLEMHQTISREPICQAGQKNPIPCKVATEHWRVDRLQTTDDQERRKRSPGTIQQAAPTSCSSTLDRLECFLSAMVVVVGQVFGVVVLRHP